MWIALQGYNIASIFLIANMTTTCTCFPLILGLVPYFRHSLKSHAVLFGSFIGLLSVLAYGWIRQGDFITGLVEYFFKTYDVGAFLIGSMSSILATLCWWSLAQHSKYLLKRIENAGEEETENVEERLLIHPSCPVD